MDIVHLLHITEAQKVFVFPMTGPDQERKLVTRIQFFDNVQQFSIFDSTTHLPPMTMLATSKKK